MLAHSAEKSEKMTMKVVNLDIVLKLFKKKLKFLIKMMTWVILEFFFGLRIARKILKNDCERW